jgi:RHS repeat-associated protein
VDVGLNTVYSYDSYGKLVFTSGSWVNPFRYTGREGDVETNLYYYRARYYDQKVGRFIGVTCSPLSEQIRV